MKFYFPLKELGLDRQENQGIFHLKIRLQITYEHTDRIILEVILPLGATLHGMEAYILHASLGTYYVY